MPDRDTTSANDSALRIVTWNIRHGGARGEGVRRVIATLLGFQADVLVVTEFRCHARGDIIIAALKEAGYSTSHPPTLATSNTVLVASKTPTLHAASLTSGLAYDDLVWSVDLGRLRIAGVYLPGLHAKIPYWDAIIAATAIADAPDLFIGDFNTGRNDLDKADNATPFVGSQYMDRMAEHGYADLWRSRHADRREYSWFSTNGGNGFRLDHAFGNRRLASAVLDCRYDHTPRLDKESDHSALIVDLAPGWCAR